MALPELRQGRRGWWIVGLDCGPVGPYRTKSEALDDKRGLCRFYRSEINTMFKIGEKKWFRGEEITITSEPYELYGGKWQNGTTDSGKTVTIKAEKIMPITDNSATKQKTLF